MKILFIGDVVGRIGRSEVKRRLSSLRSKYGIDFVIANLENATHGKGLSLKHFNELVDAGVDSVTMGNHYMRHPDVLNRNEEFYSMVRPGNMYHEIPGVGSRVFEVKNLKVRVTNIIGRVAVEGADENPFDYLEKIVKNDTSDIHIVDFHAEATAEKMCLAKAFDGKITALFGTHTHVQTRDARILPLGTAFMTDVGMCGYYDGILGINAEEAIERNWKNVPGRFQCPDEGRGIFNGVILEIDERTHRAISLTPLYLIDEE